jgi:hypothetical protein
MFLSNQLFSFGDGVTLNERKAALAWDLCLGYATTLAFASLFVFYVFAGPSLAMMLSWCMVYLVLAVVALFLTYRLAVKSPRWHRVLLVALVSGCLATGFVASQDDIVDLHLITRIYLAGGPGAIDAWAQGLILEQEQEEIGGSRSVKPQEIPPSVRTSLPGSVSVGGTLWSDQTRVRIELGGGFYHYGVVVYRTGTGPSAEQWQRILGWPPEVVIYHED